MTVNNATICFGQKQQLVVKVRNLVFHYMAKIFQDVRWSHARIKVMRMTLTGVEQRFINKLPLIGKERNF